ncbi:hypothetical protein [Streptomyces lanatus]|uniref:Secreted protein n=1 Tax=Streptomyces lanatus TaxID=66900 RepID=A0ABV1XIP2_9ACTN|nr:hypothetical protein [Streptomyces lanatus]GHG93083.1 hypothetical protein GCM10018780_15140 [Streptomyces lanatus]
MASLKRKRVLATLALTVAAGAVPLVTAAPAHATARQCENYLAGKDYIVGPKVKAACQLGTVALGQAGCVAHLMDVRVRQVYAQNACALAMN